ncbi:MAG: Zn-dependent hydrolase [Azoarcus sp.]|jgi:hydantoinase/carbamoylase family amidase|nr:Zn-dependent hydrolase [Azoarcus sp.]
MSAPTARIVPGRLWDDLMALGEIGALPGGGVSRPGLSPAEEEARRWFAAQCEQAGLQVRLDAVRNVIARLPSRDPAAKVLAIGSHLDTVPEGGRFDGALGVVAGLECARAIRESGVELPYHLEVIAFTDEEGAYGPGSVGSRAMLGTLMRGELARRSTVTGRCFADDLARLGGDPGEGKALRAGEEFAWFLELHIEQGSRLETAGKECGLVTAIVGIDRYEITVTGEAGHAGTTPMQTRKDALVMAAPLFTLLPAWAIEQNPEMVATIGAVTLTPGVPNVIPAECRFVVELRSVEPADLDSLGARLESYARDRPAFALRRIYRKPGARMHPGAVAAAEKAVAAAGCSSMTLPSGAGHDAQTFAPHVPTAMIFTPCRKGISHNPAEWLEPGQAATGAQVLLNAVLALSGKLAGAASRQI